MEYRIKQGDKFLCIKDLIMDDDTIAYTKGKVYLSEMRNCITDNEDNTLHEMQDDENFFEHFERVEDDKLSNDSAVMRSCSFCQFFQHEEIGDSDFGGVYAENPTCSKYLDTDQETEEDIPNFDRTTERDCCKLDFWRVVKVDNDLAEKLYAELDKNKSGFSETYELFKIRYNYA